ncbi:MAG TPA: DUF998 domain-containing protein [Patescibacteria group bacterium]|nr:DUF998 domain-containing protein [Patescibacteria group bacterium]
MYILLTAPILFILVTLILGAVTPNYNWKKDYISELSLGKYGWIQKFNFMICGILVVGLCVLLAGKTDILLVKLGWYLGTLMGILTALEGILDTDVKKSVRTKAGRLHEHIYNLGMSGTALAYFLIGLGYLNKPIIPIFSWTIAVFDYFWWNYSGKLGVKDGVRQRVVVFSTLLWVEVLAVWSLIH